MFRKLTIAILVFAGLALTTVGIQKWLRSRAAAQVAHEFVTALIDGDREKILSLLQPAQRKKLLEQLDGNDENGIWSPHVGFKYRIHHVKVGSSEAEVQLWIEKQGFVIQPTLHLSRGASTHWKIARIENLERDPRWLDVQLENDRTAGEQLATELQEALQGRTGVTVDRAPADDALP